EGAPGARQTRAVPPDDPACAILRLPLGEVRRLDAELDLRATESPWRLKPGVVSANGVAVAGFDGYLFIGDGANRWERQYRGELTVPPEWLAGWRELLARRQA